ncbi:MAG TPA: hypothetical protein VF221_20835 [Chloroflexota bacterium]
MFLPLVVTIVAFAFAAVLIKQFRERRRPYQLVWSAALLMGGLAGLAFVLFLGQGRNEVFFKAYYIFGALLMAAYLGLGEIYLLASRRIADMVAGALLVLSVVGLLLVAFAPVDTAVLHGSNVEGGTKAISGPAIIFIAVLNTFGAVAVIGGACYSALRVWKRHSPLRFLASNVLIATGTVLASLAGTLARVTSSGGSFWALLAAGFVVLFAGFLLTTAWRPRSAPVRQSSIGSQPSAVSTDKP